MDEIIHLNDTQEPYHKTKSNISWIIWIVSVDVHLNLLTDWNINHVKNIYIVDHIYSYLFVSFDEINGIDTHNIDTDVNGVIDYGNNIRVEYDSNTHI